MSDSKEVRCSDERLRCISNWLSGWLGKDDAEVFVQHPIDREYYEHLGPTVGELRQLVTELTERRAHCQDLLARALAIINDAILHGMPVTPEVADVSNLIRGVRKHKKGK